jgi:flagellar biosynthesis GTPase FlhF
MQIRRYVGADEKELLKKIRADLGANAVILHSSYGKSTGVFGFFARPRIEIVAGGGFKIVKDSRRRRRRREGRPGPGGSPETLQKGRRDRRLIAETQTMSSRGASSPRSSPRSTRRWRPPGVRGWPRR